MMVHRITTESLRQLVSLHSLYDTAGGFGHIDFSSFDCGKTYHVVERIVNVSDGSYSIAVVGSFGSVSACLDEIEFRADYCQNYARGCYSECEIWQHVYNRYTWTVETAPGSGRKEYDFCDSIPTFLVGTSNPYEVRLYADPEEWGSDFTFQVQTHGWSFDGCEVITADMTYWDMYAEGNYPRHKVVPIAMHTIS